MGVFDKFLNIMKLDDEDEYDEYDEYDEDDYEEDEAPKKHLFRKKEKDYDYDLEDKIVNETKVAASKPSKITPIRKRSGSGLEVCVIKPVTFEDSKEITETLLSGRAVVLNFEGLDMELAQRIIDYTCGTCVAIDGNLRKISAYIVIVTPKTVDISGDLQDILNDSFEVPGIKTDF